MLITPHERVLIGWLLTALPHGRSLFMSITLGVTKFNQSYASWSYCHLYPAIWFVIVLVMTYFSSRRQVFHRFKIIFIDKRFHQTSLWAVFDFDLFRKGMVIVLFDLTFSCQVCFDLIIVDAHSYFKVTTFINCLVIY